MQFRACKNYQDVIAFTDANFAVKRSQTGAVIKLGNNVVAWRSMKQTEVSISSAESEVQALASTEVLVEYIKTLRESLCLPTPVMKIMCDNTAANVLATGEGSWRTKSAANKVYAVKENRLWNVSSFVCEHFRSVCRFPDKIPKGWTGSIKSEVALIFS